MIQRLPASHADYLYSFGARAIAINPNGYVFTSSNPGGASRAWWCRHDDALRLAKAAFATGNVEDVAKRLRIQLTTHETVLERVQARTARLDEALQRAQNDGLLKTFNIAYRKRRLTARQTGQRFMTYANAQRRLRKAITETIANGGELNKSIVSRALES